MTDWKERARAIPNPASYFQGRTVSAGFRLPGSILLYFHDYPHEKTIISTRYMLIIPTVPLEYRVAGSPVPLVPGEALLVHPFLQRSVPEKTPRCDRLIVSFEAEGRVARIVVRGDAENLMRMLEALHPLFVEEIAVDFEELFLCEVQKRGYMS